MTTEKARAYVQTGLDLRNIYRKERENEERLDTFEAEMISFCNKHYADARKNRTELERLEITRAMEAAYREQQRRKDEAADKACTRYGYACMAILVTCCLTPLPFYAAAALIAGLAVFPTAYIVKLYGLLDVTDA